MSEDQGKEDYGARKGEKMGMIVGSEAHPKPTHLVDEMSWGDLHNFNNRTFEWDKLVDRLFEQHQTIKKFKRQGLQGERESDDSEEYPKIRFDIPMIKHLLGQDKKIPKKVIGNFLRQGFPQELLDQISKRAIELSQAEALQAATEFHNTSSHAWVCHEGRLWTYFQESVTHQTVVDWDDEGNTVMEEVNGVQQPKTKKILAKETRRIAMGICKCWYAGPVGLECNTCKQAFVILRTTSREVTAGENGYDYYWAENHCVNPYEMVRLVHSDLYHNWAVFDGEDLPLCSELASKADDTWPYDLESMLNRRNKKYEQEILPSKVAWEMIQYNLPVDLAQFCDTFHCGMHVAKMCFAHLGLNVQAFEEQYDEIFGKGEFAKRQASKRVKDTARKRDYAKHKGEDLEEY